jgi:hypothetical protein
LDDPGRLSLDDLAGEFDPPRRSCEAVDAVEEEIKRCSADLAHRNVNGAEGRIMEGSLRQVIHPHDGDIIRNTVAGVLQTQHCTNGEAISSSEHRSEVEASHTDASRNRQCCEFGKPILD